ncbi:MAG: NADH-quinone oxidoreductase subunit B [Candidatus Thermoplasmatota archaeon]|jgi:NADH-quinone oxidoreductase subunit B|uniref:NADH-quinone oxidoreductase subunit B n=1 Tax=Ferroplasma sp. TaxID=2591003 RepID=UPI0026162872|nr:NADH-quinone oxidoreductase subunit B [Ferroplasma sp.]MCL4312349.1 NADH-quinone oxidoreductase subunit B [Candidatus Thermoplasmatota archaeon]
MKTGELGIKTTTLEKALQWGRSNSLWPVTMGLACCAIEMMATQAADTDVARFGSEIFRNSPRQSDLMIVAGTTTKRMAPRVKRIYEEMPYPKYVIAMGVCVIQGGPYVDGYSVVLGVDKVIPVDVYVPGCPPTPQALTYGLITLQKKIRNETDR